MKRLQRIASNVRFAALWDVKSEGTFDEDLEAMYELEYKYHNVLRGFQGHPKRQQNILAYLSSGLSEVLERVQEVLSNLFEHWLSGHAITNPRQWAEARVEGVTKQLDEMTDHGFYPEGAEGMSLLGSAEQEYSGLVDGHRYPGQRQPKHDLFSLLKDKSSLESMTQPLRAHMIELESDRLNYIDEDDEEYEQVLERIEEFKTASVEEMLWDLESYVEDVGTYLEEQGFDIDPLATALYEQVVFPVWFARWEPEGIVETRNNVEKVYSQLQKVPSGNLSQDVATVNIALNTAHQNGDILEYLEQVIDHDMGYVDISPDYLQGLSNQDTSKWDQELQQAGVRVSKVDLRPRPEGVAALPSDQPHTLSTI